MGEVVNNFWYNAEMNKVEIPSQAGKFRGTLFHPEKSPKRNKAVMFLHGWESNEVGYAPRAQALADIGFTSLTFDLPGHGKSDGDINNLTRREFLDVTISAYDFLLSQNVDPERIGVVGASFGAYLAVLLTLERKVKWLVLRAPANYEDKGFETESQVQFRYEHPDMTLWRERKLTPGQSLPLRALQQYQDDVLIVESGEDVIVPHQSSQNYIDAASPSRLTQIVIEGADHPLSQEKWREEFIEILKDYFKDK